MEPDIVRKFYAQKGIEWSEDLENKLLHYTWYKIFKMSGLEFGNEKTNVVIENETQNKISEVVGNVVIEIEKGLHLEEGWENMLLHNIDMTKNRSLELYNITEDIFVESENNELGYQLTEKGQEKKNSQEKLTEQWNLNLNYYREIKHNGLKVKTMCKSGPNHWKWPKDDEIWYSFEEIVKRIGPPEQVDRRNVFEVKELNKNIA
ncbi:hypothetical protein JTB14_026987 [Gonioctena quinquepunctata]|nr:hypothetical protein JTB14_026987 [Gonioctena quinquepunctata]